VFRHGKFPLRNALVVRGEIERGINRIGIIAKAINAS
jgi:hypothetical protein